jgi:hypothetical protein
MREAKAAHTAMNSEAEMSLTPMEDYICNRADQFAHLYSNLLPDDPKAYMEIFEAFREIYRAGLKEGGLTLAYFAHEGTTSSI